MLKQIWAELLRWAKHAEHILVCNINLRKSRTNLKQIFISTSLYWKPKVVQVPKCNSLWLLYSLNIIAHVVVFPTIHAATQSTLNFPLSPLKPQTLFLLFFMYGGIIKKWYTHFLTGTHQVFNFPHTLRKKNQYLAYHPPTDIAFPSNLKKWLNVSYSSGWCLACTGFICQTICSSAENPDISAICLKSICIL